MHELNVQKFTFHLHFHIIHAHFDLVGKINSLKHTAIPSHGTSEMPFGHKIKPGSDVNEDDDGAPIYPIPVDQPTKGSKPSKKPSKTSTKTEPPLKYDFDSYDVIDEDDDHEDGGEHKKPNQHAGGAYGPGFFNPTLTKHQYPDYDQGIYNNENFHRLPPHQTQPPKPNQFNPNWVQHGGDAGKHELINILGNNPNLPPHVSIEQILQHIQGTNDGSGVYGGGHSQPPFAPNTPNGLNYPFGIQHPGLSIPNEPSQKIQPQGEQCAQGDGDWNVWAICFRAANLHFL